MVKVILAERKSQVLSSSNIACLKDIPAINLTAGCAHNCIYCYARGYTIFPGDNNIVVYKNILAKLKSELNRKMKKPQAVYFSPSSDIFQPVSRVLELSHSVLQFLLSKNIGVAILTKGQIPDTTMSLLLDHADKIRVQIGIITSDDNIRKLFEPGAASVVIRLRQMSEMIAGGIAVEARIIPIIPGITDTPAAIDSLLSAIANTGVKKAAISTLFLRSAIVESINNQVADKEICEKLFKLYLKEKRMAVHASRSSVIPLSRGKRELIYANYRQIADKYNLDLSTCGCMNPDIGGNCNIAGTWPKYINQPGLFDKEN